MFQSDQIILQSLWPRKQKNIEAMREECDICDIVIQVVSVDPSPDSYPQVVENYVLEGCKVSNI